MTIKQCIKCNSEKAQELFITCRGAYTNTCRECGKAISAKWYAENKERALAKSKKWFEANKERKQASIKAWGEANKEKRSIAAAARYQQNKDEYLEKRREKYHENIDKERARGLAYAKLNREAHNARVRKYRESKIERTPQWLDASDKLRMKCYYQVAKMRTRETGETWSVDHIVPLQGENVSGLNVPWNLQVIPKVQNCSKGNKLIEA